MVLTKEEYLKTLQGTHDSNQISLIDLVETIIKKHGIDNEMEEIELDKILDVILGEGKDVAIAIMTDSVFSESFSYYFYIDEGEGYITEKVKLYVP